MIRGGFAKAAEQLNCCQYVVAKGMGRGSRDCQDCVEGSCGVWWNSCAHVIPCCRADWVGDLVR